MLDRTRGHLAAWMVVVVLVVSLLPLSTVSATVSMVSPPPSTDQQLAQPIVIVNTSFLNVRSGPGAIYSSIGVLPGGTELPVLGRNRDASWWQVATVFGIGWVSAEFVLPRGDLRAVPVVEAPGVMDQPRAAVVAVPMNVFVLPDVGSSLLGMALVGSELPISGRTGDGVWWQVETNIGMGWVLQSDVALRGNASLIPVVTAQTVFQPAQIIPVASVPAASQTTTATTSSATPAGRPVMFVYRGQVAAKASPYAESEVVHYFETGDRSEVVSFSEDGRWILAEFGFHQLGWVLISDVAVSDPNDFRTQVWFDGPGMLDLKDAPSASGDLTAMIPELQRLAVVDASADGHWLLLEHWLGTGWAPANSVEIIVSNPPTTQVSTTSAAAVAAVPQLSGTVVQPAAAAIFTVPQPEPVRNYVIVNTSFLNIRSGPGSEYTVVETASGGSELDVTASTPDGAWFRVVGAFGSGWVNSEFTLFRGDFENVSIIRYQDAIGMMTLPEAVVSAPINVYRGPGVETGLLGIAPAGLNLPVSGRSADGGWLQVQTQSGAGWVLTSTITFRGDYSLVPIVQ